MKDHGDLLVGILIGAVIAGMYSAQLGLVLQVTFGLLVAVVGLKFISSLR